MEIKVYKIYVDKLIIDLVIISVWLPALYEEMDIEFPNGSTTSYFVVITLCSRTSAKESNFFSFAN
jgi:hypothetical protein